MKKALVSVLVLTMCSVAYGEGVYSVSPVLDWAVIQNNVRSKKSGHLCEGSWLTAAQCSELTSVYEKDRSGALGEFDSTMAEWFVGLSKRQLIRVQERYYSNSIFYNSKPKGLFFCKGRYDVIPIEQEYPLGLPIDLRKIPRKTPGLRNHSKGLTADGYRCRKNEKGMRPHDGVDIGCHKNYLNTPVYSTADGIVVYAGKHPDKKAAGIYVAIQHQDGYFTKYKHLNSTNVHVGDWVGAGCQIGTLGVTGGNQDSPDSGINERMAHLHYEIYFEGKKVPDKLSKIEHKRYCYDSASKKKLDNCSGTKFETIDPRPFITAKGQIPYNK